MKNIEKIAIIMAVLILFQTICPPPLMALTSGPAQPEFSTVSTVGVSDYVDLFTGDFQYALPLLNIPTSDGGFPISLSYASPSNHEMEASMVGYGWNLNVGSITRNLQGLPDDFNGSQVRRKTSIKDDVTIGIKITTNLETYGFDLGNSGLNINIGITPYYNSYKGFGIGLSAAAPFLGSRINGGLNFDSFQGLNYSMSLSERFSKLKNGSYGLSMSGNSIGGIQSLNSSINYGKLGYTHDHINQNTFVPFLDHEKIGVDVNLSYENGYESFGILPGFKLAAYYQQQRIKNKNKWTSFPAYGTMYIQNGNRVSKAIRDYNRIKDKNIREHTPYLPLSYMTKDVFSLSGISSGSFSYERSDAGSLLDKVNKSSTAGFDGSYEIGVGGFLQVGTDIIFKDRSIINDATRLPQSHSWSAREENAILETGHFRRSSEKVIDPINSSNYDYLANDDLIRPRLVRNGIQKRVSDRTDRIMPNGSAEEINITDESRNERHTRASSILPITLSDLKNQNGTIISAIPYLNTKIYRANCSGVFTHEATNCEVANKNVELLQDDQLTGFIEVDPQGKRYVYGLPSINKITKNYSASYGGDDITATEVPLNIINGDELKYEYDIPHCNNLLNVEEIPAYASSFHLTTILGDDYVDHDPSDGLPNDTDQGSWITFDYLRTHGDMISQGGAGSPDDFYKWRFPYENARFNPGRHSLPDDNLISFSYGEREQHFPYAIETSTHTAKFYYSERDDALGATDELGLAAATAKSYKLDKIELYTKGATEKLEKTVNLTYDTAGGLGTGFPNATNGKLALKSVSITNYDSNRGTLNPYKFDYFDNSNYSYQPYNVDRWGVYKPAQGDPSQNFFNPYAIQNVDAANENIKLFHLKSIELPSGAVMELDLERDDYGYVQDNVATEMMPIAGVGSLNSSIISRSDQNALKIYFELKDGTSDIAIEDYIDGLFQEVDGKHQMLFKIYSNLTGLGDNNNNSVSDNYEYVTGAANIENITKEGNYGVVTLSPLVLSSDEIDGISDFNKHPFLITAWQFLKIDMPRLLLPSSEIEPAGSNLDQIRFALESLTASFKEVPKIFKKYHQRCYDEKYGTKIDLDKSYIRLCSANKSKKGGGVRVKSVLMNSSSIWDKEATPSYGVHYDYTTTLKDIDGTEKLDQNGNPIIISSGVANNEPTMGKEANAFYHIARFEEDLKYTTDNLRFELAPFNDDKLGSASVGYSEVKVISHASKLFEDNSSIETSSDGVVQHEFYTSKDYPTILSSSLVDEGNGSTRNYYMVPGVGSLLNLAYVASQGYLSETNDMHGKPKSVTSYAHNKDTHKISDDFITKTNYIYHDKEEYYNRGAEKKKRRRLQSEVKYIDENGFLAAGELGVNRALCKDLRRVNTSDNAAGADVNVDVVGFFPFLVPVISVIPSVDFYSSLLETAVYNKSIHRNGIIKSIENFDSQSKIIASNEAYDPYVSNALVVSINNEFDNPVYNTSEPAYLKHYRMGIASSNLGYVYTHINDLNCNLKDAPEFINIFSINGCTNDIQLNVSQHISEHFIPGDEILATKYDESGNILDRSYGYVLKTYNPCNDDATDFALLLDFDVPAFTVQPNCTTYKYDIAIIRSGNRNLLSATAAQLTSLKLASNIYDAQDGVLNLGTTTYTDKWFYTDNVDNFQCDIIFDLKSKSSQAQDNPFRNRELGVFRPKESYSFQRDRNNETPYGKGIFENGEGQNSIHVLDVDPPSLDPYYINDNYDDYLLSNEITKKSRSYQVLETKNAIDVHSSRAMVSLAGEEDNCNQIFTHNSATNARYYEQLFTSFESYEQNHCDNLHNEMASNFKLENQLIVNQEIYDNAQFISSEKLIIDKKYNAFRRYEGGQVNIHFHDSKVGWYSELNASIENEEPYQNGEKTLLILNRGAGISCDHIKFDSRFRAIIKKEVFNIPISGQYSLKQDNAHTGKYSLQTGDLVYTDKKLQIEPDKNYLFSCWIKPSPELGTDIYELLEDISVTVAGTLAEPYGGLIDGWQKYRAIVMSDPSALGAGSAYQGVQISFVKAGKGDFSVDDVRISPLEAQVESYVYDEETYQLKYILDDNNYYTRYIYDGNGVLSSIQKETEKGIRTLKETRSFVKPNMQ